jgi:hypothetical protein
VIEAHPLAHIDTLDHAIAALDEKIKHRLAPHAQTVESRLTIPPRWRCAPRRH